MPALSKWSGTVVGLTLIAIGLMGIYETYFEGAHEEEEQGELKLAVAGAGWLVDVWQLLHIPCVCSRATGWVSFN